MKKPLNIIELWTKPIAMNILATFFRAPVICIAILVFVFQKWFSLRSYERLQRHICSIVMQMQRITSTYFMSSK